MTQALRRSYPGVVVQEAYVDQLTAGTTSHGLVRLSYAHGDGPERVFVKREGAWFNRLAVTALGAREVEARLAEADLDLPLESPRFLAGGADRRRLATVVVMEDVTLRGARSRDASRPLTVEEVRSGLLGLARLHAAYWQRPVPPFVKPWRLDLPWAPVSWASLVKGSGRLRGLGRGDLLVAGPAALERAFRRWAGTATTGPQTLLHGDPHGGNTYALPDGTTGFYDWQLLRAGSWAHDVGYFIVSSLRSADRRAHERALLGEYLAALGPRAPSPEDAWELYRQTPGYGLTAWIHTLSGGGFQPIEVCLAVIERFATAYVDLVVGR